MRRVVGIAGAIAGLVLGGRAARAEESALEKRVAAFLSAEGDAKRTAAAAIVEGKPAIGDVVAALSKGRVYPKDVERGWLEKMQKGSDGKERPYLLYVPKEYDPAKAWRLVVEMHGGVSRPLMTHEQLEGVKDGRGEHAEKEGYFLALPAGEAGAEWWTEVGASTVLGVIASTKRTYDVDESRIVATGFSDGGSGAYYLALAHPTPFAAFVPLNGHPRVAGAGDVDVHLEVLRDKPVYAINTDRDSLYPSATVKPITDAIAALRAPFVWREIKGYDHDPSYLDMERPAIWEWEQAQVRDPHPKTIVWAGGVGAPSRVHGLGRVVVTEGAGGEKREDVNPMLPPGPLKLGITIDTQRTEPGLAVTGVQSASAAEAAGVKAGDVVVEFDGEKVEGPRAFRTTLNAKKPGDAFKVTVQRGSEKKELSGKFPDPKPEPAFRRTKPWGYVEVTQSGNTFTATTWNVSSFELWIGAGTVDLARPITVNLNGQEVRQQRVLPDVAFLLERAAEDDDRTMLYLARLEVPVSKPEKARER